MTGGGGWLAVGCLVGAAVLAAWPSGGARARWRAISRGQPDGRAPQPGDGPDGASRTESRGVLSRLRISRLGSELPRRRTVLAATGAAGLAGFAAGGPVAALAAGVYGGLAVRAGLRRRSNVRRERGHRQRLDDLCALAADLRAGLPIPPDLVREPTGSQPESGHRPAAGAESDRQPAAGAESVDSGRQRAVGAESVDDRIGRLTRAAARLAERTGAPLADLVERIEADIRATDRGLAAANAQAAGAKATAWLLAGLPLGGIALGYGIGVDPLQVLLRTPIGAACAVAAIFLQCVGLAWADRLTGGATRAA